MTGGDNNGWNEYSKMVLKELEVLSAGINGLKTELMKLLLKLNLNIGFTLEIQLMQFLC